MANPFAIIAKRTVDFLGDKSKSIADHLSGLWMASEKKQVTEETVLSITPMWRAVYILKDILSTMPLISISVPQMEILCWQKTIHLIN